MHASALILSARSRHLVDALFPILPRWYTDPLRAHSRGLSTTIPGSAQPRLSFPHVPDPSHVAHEHELLETLYNDVWSNRFINQTPTLVLPGYFGAFFERVLCPPVILWPSPPFPPFAPIPGVDDYASSRLDGYTSHNGHNGNGNGVPESRGSPSSLLHPHPDQTPDGSYLPSPSPTIDTAIEASVEASLSRSPSMSSLHRETMDSISQRLKDPENASTISLASYTGSQESGSGSKSNKSGKRPSVMLLTSPEEGTSLGGNVAVDMIPVENVQSQDEHSQYVHLYRSVTWVLSTKEAMWDELLVRVLADDPTLRRFGWRDEDYNELASRAKFDIAIEQYQR